MTRAGITVGRVAVRVKARDLCPVTQALKTHGLRDGESHGECQRLPCGQHAINERDRVLCINDVPRVRQRDVAARSARCIGDSHGIEGRRVNEIGDPHVVDICGALVEHLNEERDSAGGRRSVHGHHGLAQREVASLSAADKSKVNGEVGVRVAQVLTGLGVCLGLCGSVSSGQRIDFAGRCRACLQLNQRRDGRVRHRVVTVRHRGAVVFVVIVACRRGRHESHPSDGQRLNRHKVVGRC